MNNISHSVEFEKKLNAIIDLALKEDIGERDHTSFATVPANKQAEGKLLIKDNGVIAGVELAQYILEKVDKKIKIKIEIEDGAKVKKGDIAFTVKGPARSLLMAERLILNCM